MSFPVSPFASSGRYCRALFLLAVVFHFASALGETMEQKADRTIVPSFQPRKMTPANALKTISAATGIKVFYTPRPGDVANITLSMNGAPASRLFQTVADYSNLRIAYQEDGVHLRDTGVPSDGPPGFFTRPAKIMEDREDRIAGLMEKSTLFKEGDPAPEATCQLLSGEEFSLSQEKGKVVLIDIFATWCGPCVAEMARLEKDVFQKYGRRKDFKMIAIGWGHTTGQVDDFRKANGLSMLFGVDPEKTCSARFATSYVPRTYLIGRDGQIKLASCGTDLLGKDGKIKRDPGGYIVGDSDPFFHELNRRIEKELAAP